MKICFVLEHFYPHVGGVETVFFEYAKRLSEKGEEVVVVTSNSGGVTGRKKMYEFEVIYLQCKSFFGHPLLPELKIEEFVKWADVIHTTTYTAALPAVKISKKLNKPCLITVHEALGPRWFKVEKNPIAALGFLLFEYYSIKKKFDCWHAISKSTKDDLIKYSVPENKINLIYHGINDVLWNPSVEKSDLAGYLGFEENKKIFLYSGRPGKTKGIFMLLEAIRRAKNDLPNDFGFGFILSDDPLKEKTRFEKEVRKYNLENLIKVADAVETEKLPGLRKAAYAVIIPSLTEGFGFNAAETSSLGVPIISSDAGSLPEIASGKLLFFENGDADDLAKKIILATQNKFETIPLKTFDWDASIKTLLALYGKLHR